MNLTEATIKALYDGLTDDVQPNGVDGIVGDVLVITDPEITTEEYDELIERAQELVEETPEGDIPFMEDYLGEYLQICPICGATFAEDHLLEPGASCPVCLEQPESFVMVGKIETEEDIAVDNGLDDDTTALEQEFGIHNIDHNNELQDEEAEVEETPEAVVGEEPEEEEREDNRMRDVASKQISGNKIVESKEDDLVEEPAHKEFELIEADQAKIQELESGSAFTYEGMSIDDENLEKVVDALKSVTSINTPVRFYHWSGKYMNDIYGLTGRNAYPEDLNFLSIDLDNWNNMNGLVEFKMSTGARWLDDIVDNNKVRQDKIDGIEDSSIDEDMIDEVYEESYDRAGLTNKTLNS